MDFNWTGTSMVVKILLLITLSLSSFAYKFKDALVFYKKGEYQRSITVLKKSHGKKIKYFPNRSLMLLAKNYEMLDKHRSALKIYFYILKKKYRKSDAIVRKHFKENKDIDEIDELSKGQLKVYYALVHSYVSIYKKNKYEQYRSIAKMYGELLIEQEYKEEEVEKLLSDISLIQKKIIDSKITKKYYLGIGYSTWQDLLTLRAPDGSESDIKSSAEGTTLFGIMTSGNLFNEYRFEFGITKAVATVGEDNSDFTYFQTNVSEVMLSAAAGYMWKTSKSVSIGLSVPIVYRTGDFTQPATFELENGDILSLGLLGNLSWNLQSILVDVKFGKLLGFHSSFAQVGLAYQF